MTKKSDLCHSQFKKISDLYNTAEQFIKEVEICQSELPIPAINELRYAGHHLLKGLVESDEEEALKSIADAEDHCNRAMYEASEAGIGYLLDTLKAFQTDYKDIPIQPIVPDYLSVRETAEEAANKLTAGRVNRTSPKEHASEYMCMFRALRKGMEQLEVARDELNKVRDRQWINDRRFMVGLAISVVGVSLALLRYLGCF